MLAHRRDERASGRTRIGQQGGGRDSLLLHGHIPEPSRWARRRTQFLFGARRFVACAVDAHARTRAEGTMDLEGRMVASPTALHSLAAHEGAVDSTVIQIPNFLVPLTLRIRMKGWLHPSGVLNHNFMGSNFILVMCTLLRTLQ